MTALDQIPEHIVWLEFECGRDQPLRASDAIVGGGATTDDVLTRYRCKECRANVWRFSLVYQRPGDVMPCRPA
jgi:hypothetical protein